VHQAIILRFPYFRENLSLNENGVNKNYISLNNNKTGSGWPTRAQACKRALNRKGKSVDLEDVRASLGPSLTSFHVVLR
jgi:hypothetical protein